MGSISISCCCSTISTVQFIGYNNSILVLRERVSGCYGEFGHSDGNDASEDSVYLFIFIIIFSSCWSHTSKIIIPLWCCRAPMFFWDTALFWSALVSLWHLQEGENKEKYSTLRHILCNYKAVNYETSCRLWWLNPVCIKWNTLRLLTTHCLTLLLPPPEGEPAPGLSHTAGEITPSSNLCCLAGSLAVKRCHKSANIACANPVWGANDPK